MKMNKNRLLPCPNGVSVIVETDKKSQQVNENVVVCENCHAENQMRSGESLELLFILIVIN